MSIKRDHSQRALNWVKWNTSKSSLNSNSNPKRAAEPEIIHLGGARVGTAFEVLELPAPDRSRPAERPLTQWAFNPPPPNPPGIGIAIASPEDSPSEIHGSANFDSDRPITQWFPALQTEGGEADKSKNEPRNLALQTAYPYVNSIAGTTEGDLELPSPLSPSSSSNVVPNSPPAAISPLRPQTSSPPDHQEANSHRAMQFPQRSTSLSQASRYAPPRPTNRTTGEVAPLRVKEVHLRRTQSNAEVLRPVEWGDSSSQHTAPERIESPGTHDLSSYDFRAQEPQSTRRSPKPIKVIQDLQTLPPLTSAPPNAPLPPISGTKLASHGRTREQSHSRGRSNSSDRGTERSPPREVEEQADGHRRGAEQKLTSKERFWLHRQYRGEAMFLKAWGLEITSEADREEGRGILRELIEGEAQEERENQAKQRMHHRSGSQSRSSTITTSSGRDGAGLDVIAEERLSREFQFHTTAQSPSSTDEAEDTFWKADHGGRDSRPGRRSRPEKHSRNQSTDSVLGQYLDLRRKHNR
ncbi:hypothetical protein SAMD00023353_0603000 [Rosellinia necatrix]|uniref:Uncharacterized protein n=1 Tax=Rosellinia necatrix TaxID=77044 RepID=A0A1S7UKW2_ROSNE|nr:hypothetical protein SAMD00023353_0603000 [Rosellinia necatrix]